VIDPVWTSDINYLESSSTVPTGKPQSHHAVYIHSDL